jgi:hypothetical protein
MDEVARLRHQHSNDEAANRMPLAEIERLKQENVKMREAITTTLEENGHLADGSDCTLLALKLAVNYDDTEPPIHEQLAAIGESAPAGTWDNVLVDKGVGA